jgi:hypothetical protein
MMSSAMPKRFSGHGKTYQLGAKCRAGPHITPPPLSLYTPSSLAIDLFDALPVRRERRRRMDILDGDFLPADEAIHYRPIPKPKVSGSCGLSINVIFSVTC